MRKRTVGYLGRKGPETPEILRRLIAGRWNFIASDGPDGMPGFRAALPEIDYLVVSATALTRDLIETASRLRFVSKFGVGYDDIAVEALWERDIVFAVCPVGLIEPVAEHALALTLSALKCIGTFDAAVRNQSKWPGWEMRRNIRQLRNETVGIVGFGRIGQAAARIFLGFGCTVLANRRPQADPDRLFAAEQASGGLIFVDDLDALVEQASIVSLHVPLTDATRHLINARRIDLLGPQGLLVNTARGGVVDQAALTRALATGRLGFAALDVLDEERPGTGAAIYALHNVIVTPHCAGGGLDMVETRAAHVLGNIAKIEAGMPVSDRVTKPAA